MYKMPQSHPQHKTHYYQRMEKPKTVLLTRHMVPQGENTEHEVKRSLIKLFLFKPWRKSDDYGRNVKGQTFYFISLYEDFQKYLILKLSKPYILIQILFSLSICVKIVKK